MKIQNIGNQSMINNQQNKNNQPLFGIKILLEKGLLSKIVSNMDTFNNLPIQRAFQSDSYNWISDSINKILTQRLPKRIAEHNAQSKGFFKDYEVIGKEIQIKYKDIPIADSKTGITPEDVKKFMQSHRAFSLEDVSFKLSVENKNGIKAELLFGPNSAKGAEELQELEMSVEKEIEKADPDVYIRAVEVD